MASVSRSLLLLCGLASPVLAAASPECRYVTLATLPVHTSGTGQLTVDGTIDDKPALMWLSLGNAQSKLMLPAVEKYGLRMDSTGKYAFGIGGASVTYAALVKDFSIGGAHSGKVAMPVVGNTTMAPAFDAIAGADFLMQADLEISLAENALRLLRHIDCEDDFLAYWSKEAEQIPFAGTASKSVNPHFIVELNGVKMEAVISTGMPRTTVSRRAAERAGIKVDAPGVVKARQAGGIGAEKVDRWTTQFTSLKFGATTFVAATLDILDTPPQGKIGTIDVTLGVDFLRAHRVLFAMGQQRLYVSHTGGAAFARRAGAH